MAHEVTIREDGTVEAAYALTPAWHGLGTVIDHCMTSEEIFKEANLDWDVEQHPIYLHRVAERSAAFDGNRTIHQQIPGQLANVRSDDHKVLGIVSEQYEVVQNWKAFEFVDALHMDGIIKYESAGSLKGGKLVWLLAKMPDVFQVTAEDKLEQYILFTTAHDGSRSVRVLPTSVRVVCWNTLSMATVDETKGLSIRHMGNIDEKLAEARRALTTVQAKFDAFHQTATKLQKVRVDRQKFEAFVNVLVPDEDGMNNTRRQHQRDSIIAAYVDGPQNLPGVRGTAWAAYSAVTQHVDHNAVYRNTQQASAMENRMYSNLMGSNNRFKRSALNLAVEAFVPALVGKG